MAYLADTIRATILAAVAGTPSGVMFSTLDHTTPSYVRKTNGSVAALGCDISCASIWNSKTLQNGGCTLLHSRIGLVARHYLGDGHQDDWIGTTFRWVTMNNTVVERVVTGWNIPVNSGTTNSTDFLLLRFNTSVTASGITVAKALPSNWQDWFPDLNRNESRRNSLMPCVWFNRQRAMPIVYWGGTFQGGNGAWGTQMWLQSQIAPGEAFGHTDGYETAYAPYEYSAVDGDSGNTLGLPIDGRIVSLNHVSGGGSGEGASLSEHIGAVNAGMDSLVSGARLTIADLSGYEKPRGFGTTSDLILRCGGASRRN